MIISNTELGNYNVPWRLTSTKLSIILADNLT